MTLTMKSDLQGLCCFWAVMADTCNGLVLLTQRMSWQRHWTLMTIKYMVHARLRMKTSNIYSVAHRQETERKPTDKFCKWANANWCGLVNSNLTCRMVPVAHQTAPSSSVFIMKAGRRVTMQSHRMESINWCHTQPFIIFFHQSQHQMVII